MSCCHCNHKHVEPTKPPQGRLSNLDYLDLLSRIEEIRAHAERVHKKEQWKCKYLFHDWRDTVDQDYDTHAFCHRCGKYKPTSRYVSAEGY